MDLNSDVKSDARARRWSVLSLGDTCTILSGGTPSKSEAALWRGSIPWVSGKDMKAPRLRDAIDHVSNDALTAGTRLAPAGSVFLLVRGMGLAKDLPVAVALRPMAFNQDIKALVPKHPQLGSFIRAAIYHERARLLSRVVPSAHGTLTLNLDDVQSLKIAVPDSIDEAIAIGSVLDLVLNKQEHAKRQLLAAMTLKSAAIRAIFARGLSGEPPNETVAGLVPHGWRVTRFIDVVRLKRGIDLPKSQRSDGDVPVYGSNGIVGWHDTAPATLPIPGVVVGRSGSIGKVGLALGPYWPLNTTLYAEDFCGNDPRFVAIFLRNFDFAAYGQGVSVPTLNRNTFANTVVSIPDADEQRMIAERIDACDRTIDLHRRTRSVLDSLLQTLLHKLMTGEILVSDLQLSALASKSDEESAA